MYWLSIFKYKNNKRKKTFTNEEIQLLKNLSAVKNSVYLKFYFYKLNIIILIFLLST